jgi:hypothetical protein
LVTEILVKFLLGGVIVSAFAVVGELFKPKTFSGIFGAAPSVALASLALAFHKDGAETVAVMARSMVIGAVALYVYGATCVVVARRKRWPAWLAAGGAWLVWFAVAFGIWGATGLVGGVR